MPTTEGPTSWHLECILAGLLATRKKGIFGATTPRLVLSLFNIYPTGIFRLPHQQSFVAPWQ